MKRARKAGFRAGFGFRSRVESSLVFGIRKLYTSLLELPRAHLAQSKSEFAIGRPGASPLRTPPQWRSLLKGRSGFPGRVIRVKTYPIPSRPVAQRNYLKTYSVLSLMSLSGGFTISVRQRI